ncbi:MAG TPA: isocitrate/isopropylmalate family dehydrogenase, partial [Devosia sp.]|nr:isocitrate/isopropylmalate family dehydrogenase [Devosia sp.]
MNMQVAVLPGDGIGLEIVPQAVKVLKALQRPGLKFDFVDAPVGGTAIDLFDNPLPEETLAVVRASDAVLFGAVGDPKFDHLSQDKKPGFALRKLRQDFELFSNLRPVKLLDALKDASSLKPQIVAGLDLLIVRELNGDIYYGTPRGITTENGERVGTNTMRYTESQIERISHVAFQAARTRR